jgi:hypothetical protein
MKITTTWNTGRHYSSNGQRIAAAILDDKRVAFVDIDRGISGITKDPIHNARSIQEFVMSQYDDIDKYNCYIADWELDAELGDLARQAVKVPYPVGGYL